MRSKKDNGTLRHKVALRQRALAAIVEPVILETHGGYGKLFEACYSQVESGVVFEKDETKAQSLARQRPSWSVYASPCEPALNAGAAAHLRFNLIDVDAYGSPFDAVAAALSHPERICDGVSLVVTDGLRQSARLGKAWCVKAFADIVAEIGNDVQANYLQVAKEIIRRIAKAAGFDLVSWYGYHCGDKGRMTHYLCGLQRTGRASVRAG